MKNIQKILIFSLLWFGCERSIEPTNSLPQNTKILLEVVETGIVDATLKIAIEDTLADYWTYSLIRNDSVISTETVVDTSQILFTDTNLLPTTEYTYQAFWMDDSVKIDSSNIVTVFTGDTTSHNFVWEIDTLGNYGSFLQDVHIVNENNIWVVGEIETDSGWYNLAKWNGSEWNLELVGGNVGATLFSIQFFNEDDIWVSSGYPKHWDGNSWTHFNLSEYGLEVAPRNACWGTSSSNIYFVGHYGSIVHYDGVEFVEMDSGTDISLYNIAGNSEYIWSSGYSINTGESILLEYDYSTWRKIYHSLPEIYPASDTLSAMMLTLNTHSDSHLSIINNYGIYTQFNNNWNNLNYVSHYWYRFPFHVDGHTWNDIFICGQSSLIAHFNGIEIIEYPIPGDYDFRRIDIKNNIVVVCGTEFIHAIVVRGQKN